MTRLFLAIAHLVHTSENSLAFARSSVAHKCWVSHDLKTPGVCPATWGAQMVGMTVPSLSGHIRPVKAHKMANHIAVHPVTLFSDSDLERNTWCCFFARRSCLSKDNDHCFPPRDHNHTYLGSLPSLFEHICPSQGHFQGHR